MAGQTRLKTLLIGCGQIGRLHASRLITHPQVELAGLADPFLVSAQQVQQQYAPTAVVSADYRELLTSTRFDAAVVCTPTGQHFDQVEELRSAGIPVLCEKPLADSREKIIHLIESARSGPLLSIAYQRRYSSAFRAVRQILQSGTMGPVRTVSIYNCERWAQTINETWRDDPIQNPGGFLGDAGSHKIDMVFFTLGRSPLWVKAHCEKRSWRVNVVTQIHALLEGDIPLSMKFVGDAHHYFEQFIYHCADGDLIVQNDRVEIARNNRRELVDPLPAASDPDTAFANVLLGRERNEAPAEIALPVWDFTFSALGNAQ